MRSALALLILLALPLVEIGGFIMVGGAIGVLPTILLVVATSIAGSMLLRFQGLGTLGRIRGMLEAGQDPSREVAHGLMIVLAGILLVIPGFVTDVGGILLFLPPVRDLAWRLLRRNLAVRAMAGSGWRRSGQHEATRTIDLDEHEYTARPDTPWRRIDEP